MQPILSPNCYAPQVRGRFFVPKTIKLLIGSSGTSETCHVPGRRSSITLSAVFTSRRARGAPRQKWMPRPKPRCRFGSRSMSKRSASGNSASSRSAELIQGRIN